MDDLRTGALGTSRRETLKQGAGIGAGGRWIAPMIDTISMRQAAADGPSDEWSDDHSAGRQGRSGRALSPPVVGGGPGAVVGPPLDHVVTAELGETVTVYDSRRQEAHVLNTTASDIWRLLDGTQSLDDVTGLLARAYGVDQADVRGDVVHGVRLLVDRGLLAPPRSP